MFVVHKKGLKLDGKNPTMLAGYGGFNISRTPTFNNWLMVWLESGGIYADAGLRGGSEYGEEWHKAGMLDRKQNVFDDFYAAAEYLIANKYTDREHIGAYGRSNGGLLTGAAMTQRPDLFKAVVCGVPLLDMLRYHQFQIAKLWIPEYGSAENPEQYKFISAYSPYQHVKEKTLYPAILFFASEGDTRVDPLHARKMTALLQARATNGPDRPILLRILSKAGHGAGKPVTKQVEEWADIFTFLFWQTGLK
jgi:prolyl oligopeptidase